MKIRKINQVILLAFIISWGCKNNQENNRLIVYAAAGTRGATSEICDSFEVNSNMKVARNYASSGTLARQIFQGGKADIFISANGQWVNFLLEKGLLIDTSLVILARNKLAMVALDHKHFDTIRFRPGFDIVATVQNKIAIGDPAHVPVGKYAKAFLDSLGWYQQLHDDIIMANDVSGVLRYVEMGECDWGVVYYTEARRSGKVKILAEIPDTLYPPVVFYIGRLKNGKKESSDLQDFFLGSKGNLILQEHGFRPS